MLESLGHRVLLAATGEQAVETFTVHRDAIKLVLLDVIMPEMGGPTALERMLAIQPGRRAIFSTGYTEEADSVRSMAQRGVLIFQKPCSSSALGQRSVRFSTKRCDSGATAHVRSHA